MIYARRTAHRRIFAALAVALPALWAAGLLLRPEVPPLSPSERRLLAEAGFAAPGVGTHTPDRTRVAGPADFEIAVATAADGTRTLAIRPTAVLLEPDLLVYWSPAGDGAPAAGSVLLGSLAGTARRSLRLPPAAAGGEVVIYSLAHGEVVARFGLDEALAGNRDSGGE